VSAVLTGELASVGVDLDFVFLIWADLCLWLCGFCTMVRAVLTGQSTGLDFDLAWFSYLPSTYVSLVFMVLYIYLTFCCYILNVYLLVS